MLGGGTCFVPVSSSFHSLPPITLLTYFVTFFLGVLKILPISGEEVEEGEMAFSITDFLGLVFPFMVFRILLRPCIFFFFLYSVNAVMYQAWSKVLGFQSLVLGNQS